MKRLTWTKPDGSWGIEGIDIKTLPTNIYMCLFKLKKYEDTGLSPDEVEDMQDDYILQNFEEAQNESIQRI